MLPFVLFLSLPWLVPAVPVTVDGHKNSVHARSIPLPWGKNSDHQSYVKVDRVEQQAYQDQPLPAEQEAAVEEAFEEKSAVDPRESRSQHRQDFKQDSLSEGNSVVLFNGVPVEVDHKPVMAEDLNINYNNYDALERRSLSEKLGLDFMGEREVDEEALSRIFQTPGIGFGSRKESEGKEADTEDVEYVEDEVEQPALHKQYEASEPMGETVETYSGNKFTFYNGKPINVPERHLARRDVRDLLNLGMFAGVPGRGRRKSPVIDNEDETLAEQQLADEKAEGAIERENTMQKPAPQTPEHSSYDPDADDEEEITMEQLKGNSFVLYNGKPVEINGKPVSGKKIKKIDSLKSSWKRGLAEKVTSRVNNPFKDSGITKGDVDLGVTKGDTFSETLVDDEVVSYFPLSQEEETVNVEQGENYVLFNGKPQKGGIGDIF